MITNIGKQIIAKYMLGQVPAYASYVAIGCGPKPLQTEDALPDYSAKESLDFEMLRVPISSRGVVNESGISKIVLTAELPTEERYEITEVGIYSAGSNASAGSYDSKTIFSFSQGENWQYNTSASTTSIPTITAALDAPANDNVIITTEEAFQTNADNSMFYKTSRLGRYERCRFLNNMIILKGNSSDLTIALSTGLDNNHFEIELGSNNIQYSNPNLDFTKNSPIDELRLAFSIISKNGASSSVPDTVRILVEFLNTSGDFARFEADLDNGLLAGQYDFTTNRYYVITKQLQELYTTQGFSWNSIIMVKIYTCAIVSDLPSANYYIALDAMKLENVSTLNPLYGLTGYSVIQNTDSTTVVKSPNTNNYVEFRFSIGVT